MVIQLKTHELVILVCMNLTWDSWDWTVRDVVPTMEFWIVLPITELLPPSFSFLLLTCSLFRTLSFSSIFLSFSALSSFNARLLKKKKLRLPSLNYFVRKFSFHKRQKKIKFCQSSKIWIGTPFTLLKLSIEYYHTKGQTNGQKLC